MEREVKEFALGTAVLYAAPGIVPERELEDMDYRIGEARDGCRLTYECKTKELFDIDGNAAATLRFDEKAKFRGKLTRIFASGMPVLFSGLMKRSGRGTVSMLIKCPLPDGEHLRFYMVGGVMLGASFDMKEGGCAEFEMIFGKDAGMPRLILKGGGEYR